MCACAWVCKWKSDCVLWQCKRVMCTKGSIWYIKNKMSAWECADVIVSDAFLGTWKYGNLIQQDNKQGSKTLNKAQPAICKPSPTTHNRGTHTLRGSQAPFHIHTPPPPHTNTQASHSRHGLGWQPSWVLYVCRNQLRSGTPPAPSVPWPGVSPHLLLPEWKSTPAPAPVCVCVYVRVYVCCNQLVHSFYKESTF